MQQQGLRSSQVAEVRGLADQQPRNPKAPGDASNRRITLLVKYIERKAGENPPHAEIEGTAPIKAGSQRGDMTDANGPAAEKSHAPQLQTEVPEGQR
jgi:hypothetical protein